MKKIVALVLTGLVCLVATASFAAEEKPFKAAIDSDGVQRVEMVGGSYFFTPNRVIVKVNVPVELKVKKESGVTPHNITIKAPEAGISFDEPLGSDPKVIKFTPKKTGTYPFLCTKKLLFFESHNEKGMHGMLEVVE